MNLLECAAHEQNLPGMKYRRKTWHKDFYIIFNSHGQIRVYDAGGQASPSHDLGMTDYLAADWEVICSIPEKVKNLTWTEVCQAAKENPNLLFKNSHYDQPQGMRLKDFLMSIHKDINNLGFFHVIGFAFLKNDWEIVGTTESPG